eukprot:scaffold61839_cov69-Phaeocystis_antarctica.AAC.6
MLAAHPVTPPYLQLYLLTYLVGGHEAADWEPLAPKGLGDLIAKVSIEVDHVVDERQARCRAVKEGAQCEDEELAKEVDRLRVDCAVTGTSLLSTVTAGRQRWGDDARA